MNDSPLQQIFDQADSEIAALERSPAVADDRRLVDTLEQATGIVRRLILAYLADAREQPLPEAQASLLDCFRLLVKGDPSWNTIRDNCRELEYYRNCLLMGREDALPAHPVRMTLRTLRHVYLFMKSRSQRENRLETV